MVQYFSSQRSAEGDPSPLAPLGNQTSWLVNAGASQMIAVVIKVSRFWQWNLISGVLPILVCSILGLLVFFQDPSDLGARLSVVVTLFLALTAVQFVLAESMPRSSYVGYRILTCYNYKVYFFFIAPLYRSFYTGSTSTTNNTCDISMPNLVSNGKHSCIQIIPLEENNPGQQKTKRIVRKV